MFAHIAVWAGYSDIFRLMQSTSTERVNVINMVSTVNEHRTPKTSSALRFVLAIYVCGCQSVTSLFECFVVQHISTITFGGLRSVAASILSFLLGVFSVVFAVLFTQPIEVGMTISKRLGIALCSILGQVFKPTLAGFVGVTQKCSVAQRTSFVWIRLRPSAVHFKDSISIALVVIACTFCEFISVFKIVVFSQLLPALLALGMKTIRFCLVFVEVIRGNGKRFIATSTDFCWGIHSTHLCADHLVR